MVDSTRYYKKTRYTESTKDEALAKISNEKEKIINELTIYFG